MWLMTKHGFYSIVRKKSGEFHVRSRERHDLESLLQRVPLPGVEIQTSSATDYSHRIIVGREMVLKILQFLGETLDYGNFKEMIHENPDQSQKTTAYGEIWKVMFEEFGGYGKAGRQRTR